MNGTKKILVGNIEPELTEYVAAVIRNHLGNFIVELLEAGKESEIRQVAQQRSPNLIILILNNILYDLSGDISDTDVLKHGEELVAHLKSTYGMPIIAMSGLYDDPDLPRRLLRLGVNAFFYLPLEAKPFALAVECCLNEAGRQRDASMT